jgi:hypothetical protein
VHGQSGQATVESVALVLLAALVLGAAAAFAAGREPDRGLGELVAKRIARAPREVGLAAAAPSAPGAPTPSAGPPAQAAPGAAAPPTTARHRTPASAPRGLDPSPAVKGAGTLAKRAWIGCLGYKRWRYEREHPLAAIEGLPVGEALGIANECLNPYEFLFGD